MTTLSEPIESKAISEAVAMIINEKETDRGTWGEDDQVVNSEFQKGVKEIEAVTIVCSKVSLIAAFAIVGGIANLSIAKIPDVFGRPQGFFISSVLGSGGLIMSATCTNVEMYAASQVVYTIGMNGIGYSLSVFIADSTTLRNRGLVQALTSSPGMITVWIGGPISTTIIAAMKPQQYFAIALTVVSTTGNVGLAIGLTILSVIWQRVFPAQLALYLSAEDMEN